MRKNIFSILLIFLFIVSIPSFDSDENNSIFEKYADGLNIDDNGNSCECENIDNEYIISNYNDLDLENQLDKVRKEIIDNNMNWVAGYTSISNSSYLSNSSIKEPISISSLNLSFNNIITFLLLLILNIF